MKVFNSKTFAFLICFLLLLGVKSRGQDLKLQSPDENIELSIKLSEKLYYTISKKNEVLLKDNFLTLTLSDAV